MNKETQNIMKTEKMRIVMEPVEIQGAIWHTFRVYQPSPKAMYFKEKLIQNYRFKTVESRDEYANNWIQKNNEREAQKAQEKANFAAMKKNLVNPFKVGDIFYDSWGYDQTNIDFYQIVEVGKKSVKIRGIDQNNEGECGFMCEYVSPKKDAFISEPETHILQMMRNGEVYITSRHGWISKWENKERIYQSHYA